MEIMEKHINLDHKMNEKNDGVSDHNKKKTVKFVFTIIGIYMPNEAKN